ncbi:MAG: hypothetical protein D4R68_05620 [Ignavibacteriales bacterium]|nr:MAG: hypothetical protein D4R68_05620 [Ignavibacteriales bacterium]
MEEITEILKSFSIDDLEKFKLLFSLLNGSNQKEVVTLRVFVEEYSDLIKHNRSKAYYDSVVYSLKHLTDFFGSQKSIQSLGLRDIETFVTHLQQKVTRGYRVYHRTLKAAFNKAIDWGYMKENYFLKVKLPKKQKVDPLFINSNQLSDISDQIKCEVVKDAVIIGFYTGMRLGEVINLKWKNVNLATKIITVGDEEFITKGRNQRYIPICDEAFEILERCERSKVKSETESVKGIVPHANKPRIRLIRLNKTGRDSSPDCIGIRRTNGFVFCKSNGEQFTGDYFSQVFKRACKAAGMDPRIHFHTLRHSFASNLAQKGVSLYTIKELLGHSSISTTEIYAHLNLETLQKAIKTFDRPHRLTPAPSEPPLSRGEFNEVKIFRINSGEN